MRPDLFLATIGRGSNGSNALEVTEDRAAVTAESQDNIINRVNNVSQYGPSWHYVPGIGVAGTAYAEVPGSALGDLTFSRASSKTRTNSAGVVETIGNNVPPHDYRNADGTLSTFPRLNLEPQRTNSIRNSSMVGAVAGSPGTLPTNWSVTSSGLTRTIVGIGTELGLPYIDIRLNGTANAVFAEIYFDAIISASAAQSWTNVFYSKIISAPTAPNSYILATVVRGSSTTIPSQAFTPTTNLSRFAQTITTPTGATSVQPGIGFSLTNGAAYDFTIRIAAPQMELGAYATSYIPTTTAAVTRLADSASKTGVSSLIGQTEGAIFLDFEKTNNDNVGLGGFFRIHINDGSSTNSIYFGFEANQINVTLVANGILFVSLTTTGVQTQKRIKAAFAYKENDFTLYVNGIQIGTDTSGSIPSNLSEIRWGVNRNTATQTSAVISEQVFFPTRLTNAQLAQLTTL